MENNTISTKQQPHRDSKTVSPWQNVTAAVNAPATFSEGNIYDALIVGGGITGLTTALLLQKQGKQCIIAEAYTIGFGTTGGTSAHLNTFFDATYADVESDFGADKAKLLAKCGKEAMAMIFDLAAQNNIDCDLEYKDGYLYAETDAEVTMLEDIFAASQRAGAEVEEAETNGLVVPFKKSIVYRRQGQFHPLKYINGLADAFIAAGGVILENTFIRDSEFEDGIHVAKAVDFNIRARNLVYATHLPPGINIMDFNCAPYRSYVIGVKLTDNNYPDALSYDCKEPYHYFRTHTIDGQKYLLVGGEDHKTGHDDPAAAFAALEDYIRIYYNVAEVSYKWSSQYYVPADQLPFIGKLPMAYDNLYMATGYNGNGMMFGTISGKILSDIITGKENEYQSLFNPARVKPVAGFMDFVKENADVAYKFIADRFSSNDIESLKDLPAGTGDVVTYNGEKVALYKDEAGKVTALNPTCTHTGCIVCFNNAEKSWDCPCHGGRFDVDGKVLTGPPRKDLQQIDIEQ